MEKHIDFTIASFQSFKRAIQTSFSEISKERCFGMNVWYTLPAKCRRKQPAWSLHPIIVPIQANVTPAITAMLHFATMSSRDLQSSFCDRSWTTCASSAGIVAGSWNCVRDCSCLNMQLLVFDNLNTEITRETSLLTIWWTHSTNCKIPITHGYSWFAYIDASQIHWNGSSSALPNLGSVLRS